MSSESSPVTDATAPTTRVMLVEDEFLIRLTLSEVLSDEGYEVIEAETGDQAMALLNGGLEVQVLLTDIQLPGLLDGNALVAQARRLMPTLPVIFMSGRPEQHPLTADPSIAHVSKPYLPSDICRAIKALLANAAA